MKSSSRQKIFRSVTSITRVTRRIARPIEARKYAKWKKQRRIRAKHPTIDVQLECGHWLQFWNGDTSRQYECPYCELDLIIENEFGKEDRP